MEERKGSRHGVMAKAGSEAWHGKARPEQAAVAQTGRHTKLASLFVSFWRFVEGVR